MNPMSLLNDFRRWLGESRRNQFLAASAALVAGGTLAAAGLVVAVSGDGDRQEQVVARTATPSSAATEAPTRTPRRTTTSSPSPTPEPVETLAFLREGDIWLINADGSDERRLTQFAGTQQRVESAEWLSTGRELTYRASYEGGAAATDVVGLVDVDGEVLWERGQRVQLASGVFWAPDGRLVAVFNPAEDPHARIEDRDGQVLWSSMLSGFSQLKAAPFSLHATWSADGRSLAFVDGEEIVVISGEPLAARRIDALSGGCGGSASCFERAVYGGLAFAPNGNSLILSMAREGLIATVGNAHFEIYRVDLELAVLIPVLLPLSLPETAPMDFGQLPRPVFSPDGGRLAYRTSYHLSACENFARLVTFESDGSNARSLLPPEIAETSATPAGPDTSRALVPYLYGFSWSPGSDSLAAAFAKVDCSFFDQAPAVVGGLYLVRPDRSGEKKLVDLTLPPGHVWSGPVWSPSERLIAYASGQPDAPHIFVVDVATERVTDLGPGSAPAWQPQP